MQWIYQTNEDNTARFALGQIFDAAGKTLICFGINPSTATPDAPDNTIRKLINIARYNGYDNWIMLNLYPQRATDPNDIHQEMNEALVQENLACIRAILAEYAHTDVLLAYGNLIAKRAYFKGCLEEILAVLKACGASGVKVIKMTKQNNPVHPLYQKNESVLVDYVG